MSDTQPTPPAPSRRLVRAQRWAIRLAAVAEGCRAEAERCAYWALLFAGAAGVLAIKARAKAAEAHELAGEEFARIVDHGQALDDVEGVRATAHRFVDDLVDRGAAGQLLDVDLSGNGAGDQLVEQPHGD